MKSAVYIILAGCLWGMIAIFINILNALGLSAMECVAIRVTITAGILFTYLLFTAPKKLRIKLEDLKYFIGTGLLSIVFFNYCYFEAIKIIGGAAVPALLLYTAPAFVMILSSIFFNEKITLKKVMVLMMTFIGLGFVTGAFNQREALSIHAVMLGLGSGLGYALYSIFGKILVKKYDEMTITFYTFMIATIGAIPLSRITTHIAVLGDINVLLVGVGLAILSTILPFILYTKGLKGVEAGMAAILATIEPFVAAIVGICLFHEQFTMTKIIGMTLILMAIVSNNCHCPYFKFKKSPLK